MSDDIFNIRLSDLGDDVKEVTIVDWLKNPGDPVQAGEPLLEVMTDKANIEIESPESGILSEIIHGKDTVVGKETIIGRLFLQR